MKIGITGATGFLGHVLAELLHRSGHELRLFSRHAPPPNAEKHGQSIHTFHGNPSAQEDLEAFCRGMEVVFHLAGAVILDGSGRKEMERTNVQFSRMLAQACLKEDVRRMVHCSSIGALERPLPGQNWDENRPLALRDRTDYNASKARAEVAVLEIAERGLETVIVNPTGVIGPFDRRPSLAGKNILDLMHGKSPATVGGGFDFVDVRDVAEGMVLAMEKGQSGERYILGGHYLPLRELSKTVAAMAGKRPPVLYLPIWTLRALQPFVRTYSGVTRRPAPYTREMIDATLGGERIVWEKARSELGYQARLLEETLKDTVDWFRANFPE